VKKAVILWAIIVLLLISLLLMGCGSSAHHTVISMMKRMPDDTTEFYIEDLKKGRAIRAEEICDAYDRYLKVAEETFLEWGIDVDEADSFAWCITDTFAFLFEGDFTLDIIRRNLEESGLYHDEYRGVEIWMARDSSGESGYEGPLIHALINSRIIVIGTERGIDSCLDVIKEGATSIYEKSDFRDIIERLPEGLVVSCSIHWKPEVEGIIVGGFSLVMNSDGTQDFTWVGKFENNEAASNAIDIIMSDLADDFNFNLATAQETQDGIYLTITAEAQEIY